MAELTSTTDSKFKLGDLVWARVKGYNYWPSQIVKNDEIKLNRKIKNPHCVYFFGSNNYAYVSEDQIKNYEEFRDQFSNIPKKSAQFRQALDRIEEELAKEKGATGSSNATSASVSATNSSSSSSSSSSSFVTNVSSTTPDTNKSDLFKAKKIPTTPTALTRDYSRTPFKKEKRNFETNNEMDHDKKSSSSSPMKMAEDNKKKVRIASPLASMDYPSPSHSAPPMPNSSTKVINDLKQRERMLGSEKMSEMRTMNKLNKSKPSSLKFGFIGLGKMGQKMVKLLLDSGHEITIWNRTPSKCKDLEKFGANIVKTPGDVVRESDITFSCLSDSAASQTIFFGNCGVSSEINATKGYVELTSIDSNVSKDIESSVKSKGGRYLEAPILICALPEQIQEGKMVAMVSGNRSLFDDCGTCFEAICSHVYFLSETAGIASKMNIVVSTYYGNTIGMLLECMTLVERFGLIQKDFVEIISRSPLNSPLIESKTPSLVDQTLIRDIPIDHIRRDLGYCLHEANQKSYTTPITASVNEVFKQKKHHYY